MQAKSRVTDKRIRQQQLIKSTIDSIAKRGFAETTLANVAQGAGLSQGIVNFHFHSKELLFNSTLQYLADEYRAVWTKALRRASQLTADKLHALVMADFDPLVFTRKKVAVWHAFFGEAKSRPTYLKVCDARDREHLETLIKLCRQLLHEDDRAQEDEVLVASGIQALTDGLWLDHLLNPRQINREFAKLTATNYLRYVFPRYFSVAGATGHANYPKH